MLGIGISIRLIKQNANAFKKINFIFYGTILLGMFTVYLKPSLHTYIVDLIEKDLQSTSVGRYVARMYDEGHLYRAAASTFAVNVLVGSLLTVTLPSFIIPYSGLGLILYRTFLWGCFIAPPEKKAMIEAIPHFITLIIEGQAYVVAALPVLLHGRQSKVLYQTGGVKAWLRDGLGLHARALPLVCAILFFAGIWEAYEVIHLLPPSAKKYGH
ncbi:uncharacterized protein FA14DRAFT_159156 [Meira miltonrushii]|uniref:Stage II sporulation protein M n=1 Tax=Meira miltonrushii TaxID=1280837 RepID=A0A316VL46_9BASI|nr:uncharacterized protein FA14DRAFT_159156 [Meira miltonrushii]PWN36791.1 hypothetical protein FA14DRAFT_159156 [Meira miltonrushii]